MCYRNNWYLVLLHYYYLCWWLMMIPDLKYSKPSHHQRIPLSGYVIISSTIVFYVNISYWPVQTGYWKVYSMLWEDISSIGYQNHLLCTYYFPHKVLCCCWYARKFWNKIWYCHWYSTLGFVRLNIILQKVPKVPKLVLFDGELVGGHF